MDKWEDPFGLPPSPPGSLSFLVKDCRCGRGPHRPGQRNCLLCNREANRKYRAELKRLEARLKMTLARQG